MQFVAVVLLSFWACCSHGAELHRLHWSENVQTKLDPLTLKQHAPPSGNIVQLAEKLGAKTLVKLVKDAGLQGALSGKGPFTVFGPTDKAFKALPKAVLDLLMANKTALQEVLKYHVILGDIFSSQLKNNLIASSLQGAPIRVNIYKDGKVITASGCEVILPDQNATNGVIHVVDKVLFPVPVGTIVGTAVANHDFRTLVLAVTKASLTGALSAKGPFTVFAPTNEAFSKLPPGAFDRLLHNVTELTQVLLYHVVNGSFYSAGLSNGDVKTLNGKSVTIKLNHDAGVLVNTARVVIADVSTTNGVIHAIDEVLLPPALRQKIMESHTKNLAEPIENLDQLDEHRANPTENIVQLATKLGATTLVKLLQDAGLVGALGGPGPFTVFGPSNQAFNALPNKVIDQLKSNVTALQEVLKYHVISGDVFSSQLKNDMTANSLQGSPIRINIYGTDTKVITADGCKVDLADQNATNGVIHVVDKVLYPIPSGTIVDLAKSDKHFSTLVSLVVKANLAGTLSSAGPFTVFAPTNEAFEKLPADVLNKLVSNVTALGLVLRYHVVQGTVYSAGLVNGEMVPTVNGAKLTVNISSSAGVLINSARVVMADLSTTNGVVHVIDSVLIPPTMWEDLLVPAESSIDEIEETNTAESPRFNILDLADNLGAHTLVQLVQTAGLGSALRYGKGPFTVFGPSDAAFKKLKPEIVMHLLSNVTALKEVLEYHVIAEDVYSSQLKNDLVVKSMQGAGVRVNIYGEKITASGCPISKADQNATNGVIHVLDCVMTSIPTMNAAELVASLKDFKTLKLALQHAGLVNTLSGSGPFTIFAPTDVAFNALPPGMLDHLLHNVTALTQVLTYHVVKGTFYSAGLKSGDVRTVNGKSVKVDVQADGMIKLNGNSYVVWPDTSVSNGVIHSINQVLLPPTFKDISHPSMKNLIMTNKFTKL
ncbi:transforming growth factor-beta-induced protein ig-h3 [Lingula anatina]|uniref:Transforming growth factor-beta-induced protein ig-h3 n=1 Tax=Lingula anatina TaxID=7574 RepID=A0A1S3K058_LINAN|nr:transforming growth factor-beta-induced protein ig-h3 [Lingula anatina]|eukprot:XP_013415927.1 transforming growth factor-beta-induced protein ig-h3 [Lingula anatina]